MAIPYKKILVSLDGSELAAKALPHAQEIARRTGAHLILLQAVPDAIALSTEPAYLSIGTEPVEMYTNEEYLRNIQSRWTDEAREMLQEIANQTSKQGIQVHSIIEIGMPAETIIDYAGENDIDLIVMSTHGRSGVARWVHGSVAAKVLLGAPCPILLIRAIP